MYFLLCGFFFFLLSTTVWYLYFFVLFSFVTVCSDETWPKKDPFLELNLQSMLYLKLFSLSLSLSIYIYICVCVCVCVCVCACARRGVIYIYIYIYKFGNINVCDWYVCIFKLYYTSISQILSIIYIIVIIKSC